MVNDLEVTAAEEENMEQSRIAQKILGSVQSMVGKLELYTYLH